jgi:hypothetical protein
VKIVRKSDLLPNVLRILLSAVVLTSVFQAASLTGGSIPLIPSAAFELLALPFILVLALTRSNWVSSNYQTVGGKILLAFCLYSIISALLFPFLFEGTPILNPRDGMDDAILFNKPLEFSLSNIGQAIYIVLNVSFLFGCIAAFQGKTVAKLRRVVLLSGWLALGIIIYESAARRFGLYFPDSLIYSNSASAIISEETLASGFTRISGTFSEGSYATAFFASFFIYYFSRGVHVAGRLYDFAKAAAYFVGLVLAAASTGYVAVGICLPLIVVVSAWSLKRLPVIFVMLVVIISLLYAILQSDYAQLAGDLIFDKTSSGSFDVRTTADARSFQLFLETSGIGVGLGASRSSSFFATMLSNVGFVGTLLFAAFLFQILRVLWRNRKDIEATGAFWFLVGGLVSKLVSVPDLSAFTFWAALSYAAAVASALSTPTNSGKNDNFMRSRRIHNRQIAGAPP